MLFYVFVCAQKHLPTTRKAKFRRLKLLLNILKAEISACIFCTFLSGGNYILPRWKYQKYPADIPIINYQKKFLKALNFQNIQPNYLLKYKSLFKPLSKTILSIQNS